MMSALHRRRIGWILWLGIGLSVSIGFLLLALSQNVNFFYSPSQLAKESIMPQKLFRIGGMVVKGSVKRKDNLEVEFCVTDFIEQVVISYKGSLPDLFREGQGIVALGRLVGEKHVQAVQVLAKHDEKYMPPEVAESIRNKAIL